MSMTAKQTHTHNKYKWLVRVERMKEIAWLSNFFDLSKPHLGLGIMLLLLLLLFRLDGF
jgi:hypothetical protein